MALKIRKITKFPGSISGGHGKNVFVKFKEWTKGRKGFPGIRK
jgi:hypothetical protein